MSEVLAEFPGAQRAMFRRYHIGGCASCGFQPTETLAQVCARNENIDPSEVLEHIRTSHEQDAKILIDPKTLAELLKQQPGLKLLDIRTREEHEAVKLPSSSLLSQPLMQEAMGTWSREEAVVVYDHLGAKGLDAATYFIGHGFKNVRCLAGGIDAWSQQIDSSLPRYRLT